MTQTTKKDSKMEERIVNLEDRNAAQDIKEKDDRTITLKELYERIIVLETRLESIYLESKNSTGKFVLFTYAILGLLIINVIMSFLIYLSSQGHI